MKSRNGIVIVDKWIDRRRSSAGPIVALPLESRCNSNCRFQARAWDPHAPPRRPGDRPGRYLTQSFPTQRAANEWGQERRVEFTKGVASAVRTTIRDVGDLYLAALRDRIGDPPTQRHLDQVAQVLAGLEAAGAVDLAAPAFPDLTQRWIGRLTAKRKWQRTAVPASSSLKLKFLTIARSIVNFARERRFIAFDPLAGVKTARLAIHRRQVYAVDEMRCLVSDERRFPRQKLWEDTKQAVERCATLREAAQQLGVSLSTVHYRLNHPPTEDPWWRVAVLCTYLGCRVGTALAITPGLVDLEEQRLVIPAKFPGNKTKLEMLLPIQPELFEILQDIIRTRGEDPTLPLVGSHFLTYTQANLTHGFKEYVRRTGIDPGSRGAHALRHSFCSLMTALGQSPFLVMGLVGHLSAQVHKNYTQSAVLYERAVATWPRRGRFYLRTNPPAGIAIQGVAE